MMEKRKNSEREREKNNKKKRYHGLREFYNGERITIVIVWMVNGLNKTFRQTVFSIAIYDWKFSQLQRVFIEL